MNYPKLFEPGKIGKLEIKNRIVMEPLATGTATENQTVGVDYFEYLVERAKGGVGLIILENTRVDDLHGVAAVRQCSMARDEQIEPMKELVAALHAEGVKVFTQLHHPGRETFSNLNSNEPVWSSSDKPCGVCQQETHMMTTEETKKVIRLFIDAAVRTKKSGCDGVELHGAHGYLISQFLSPYTNQRGDEYGGSLENRFRFLKEIIEGIRAECGADFPLSVRLTVDELLDGNEVGEYLDLEMGLEICKKLEALGIDILNVSNGIYESFNSLSEPMTYPQGCRSELIRAVRDTVSTPLMAVNMVKEPAIAEQLLAENLVDFVGLGRAVVADPQWPAKAFAGREDEINRCISCTFCFETLVSDAIAGIGPVKCAVNARAAREAIYPGYPKDGEQRIVAVIGAGVAGLEAARVLAERDFRPVVWEKEAQIGGQINVADKPPQKEKIDWIVEYLKHQLTMLGVEIRTGVTATPELLKELEPHAVFVATGAVPLKPAAIPGVELPNVITVDDALCGNPELRGKDVVIVGSGATGLETAEFLCERDNNVTIVEMLPAIGEGVYVQHYLDAMDRLSKYDVQMMPSTKVIALSEEGAQVSSVETGEESLVKADYIVLAMGVRPVNELAAPLTDAGFENVVVIGDAREPGRIESAIRSAFEAGYTLC